MSTEIRPTPETDAAFWHGGVAVDADFARKLERERDEALALAKNYSERWTAECKTLRGQIEAMREAIKEACEALADLSERWEETPEWHNMAEHNSAWCGKIFTNVRQCKKSHDALAKLQPFFKP